MRPRFVEAAQCIQSGDGGLTAFHQEWRTLLRRVSHRFWWLDRARIEDAVGDAILRRLEQNGSDGGRVREETGEVCLCSLYGEACRNVCDGIRMDTRRGCREQAYARQKRIWQYEDFSVQNELSAAHICIEAQQRELETLLKYCSAGEQALIELRKEGIKDLTPYASVLGVEQCALEEQRRAVNRAWNRIRMKLLRLKERRSGERSFPQSGERHETTNIT